MIKDSQEEIQELSAPFKKMFENSIEKTKEEIVQRNIKTKLQVSKTNNNTNPDSKVIISHAASTQGNSELASTLGASQELQKSQSKKTIGQTDLSFPMESKQILLSQFTESDKRNVIQKFLLSHEVLFLVYGLMFPSQTIAAANQALSGPFQPEPSI